MSDLFMVFDVESIGLHGEGFAVGAFMIQLQREKILHGPFSDLRSVWNIAHDQGHAIDSTPTVLFPELRQEGIGDAVQGADGLMRSVWGQGLAQAERDRQTFAALLLSRVSSSLGAANESGAHLHRVLPDLSALSLHGETGHEILLGELSGSRPETVRSASTDERRSDTREAHVNREDRLRDARRLGHRIRAAAPHQPAILRRCLRADAESRHRVRWGLLAWAPDALPDPGCAPEGMHPQGSPGSAVPQPVRGESAAILGVRHQEAPRVGAGAVAGGCFS